MILTKICSSLQPLIMRYRSRIRQTKLSTQQWFILFAVVSSSLQIVRSSVLKFLAAFFKTLQKKIPIPGIFTDILPTSIGSAHKVLGNCRDTFTKYATHCINGVHDGTSDKGLYIYSISLTPSTLATQGMWNATDQKS